jgi:hypothetical protein
MEQLKDPSFCESFLGDREDCPFCEEVFSGMSRGITLYREEIVQSEVPSEVHIRLHTVIRRQWVRKFEENQNGGVTGWE